MRRPSSTSLHVDFDYPALADITSLVRGRQPPGTLQGFDLWERRGQPPQRDPALDV